MKSIQTVIIITVQLLSTDLNIDCGVTGVAPCGSEQWFLSNDLMRPFVLGSCQNTESFTSFSLTVCLCPYPASVITPCTCALSPSNTTVSIDCRSQSLTEVGTKIDNIPTWSPVDTIDFSSNLLTAIPANLVQYTQLINLKLASNSISSVGANDLSGLTASILLIDLSLNSISTIAEAAFPGDTKCTYNIYFLVF